MNPMPYLLARPLAFIALLAIALNTVLWGWVVRSEGATLWLRLVAIALVSLPALANLALGLMLRPRAQPAIFFVPASAPSFLAIGLFVFQQTARDAQSGIAFAILWGLQLLALPLCWGVAFALRRLSGGAGDDLPRASGTTSRMS
jgi:quinol-cytochrome oxidoreductase complex cytochrome b subunit